MAHTNQDRWASLVDAKLRNTLVTRDNLVFNSRYEGNPKAGKVKIPVRDTEVEVKTYDKADGRHAPPRPADETGGACLAQPSKFPSGRRPAPEIWATARGSRPRSSAPCSGASTPCVFAICSPVKPLKCVKMRRLHS